MPTSAIRRSTTVLMVTVSLCLISTGRPQAGPYECSFKATLSEVPADAGASPAWTDDRIKTATGRNEILGQASILSFYKLYRCKWSGSRTALLDMLPYCGERGCAQYIDITESYRPGWQLSGYSQFSLQASYESIQKHADAGARQTVNVTETPPGRLPYLNFDARVVIEVFPAVFERQQLWIKSEKRWARTPSEAMCYVLLHELGHLDSEMCLLVNRQAGRSVYKPIDASENGAWQYAQSVMRCENPEP